MYKSGVLFLVQFYNEIKKTGQKSSSVQCTVFNRLEKNVQMHFNFY